MFVFMNFCALNVALYITYIYINIYMYIYIYIRLIFFEYIALFEIAGVVRKIIFMLTTGQQFAFINTLRLKDWS